MARYRSRKKGIGLPAVFGTVAVMLLLGCAGFVAYVYFFVPPEEEAGAVDGPPSVAVAGVRSGSSGSVDGRGPTPVAGTGQPAASITAGEGSAPSRGAAASAAQAASFRSSLFPYGAQQPDKWVARPGGLKVGQMTVDAFVGPAQSGFTPSITIYVQPVPEGVSSEMFLLTNLKSLGAGGIQAKSQPESVPAGAKAQMISYTAAANGLRYNVDQVVFVQDGRGWVVTLSSPLADDGACVAALRQFLSNFKADAPGT